MGLVVNIFFIVWVVVFYLGCGLLGIFLEKWIDLVALNEDDG